MLTTEIIIQTIVSGILMGCIYALVAVGLCLIWGLMEIVNFAHGDYLMMAMFTSFWAYTLAGIDPLLSLPLCLALLFAIGWFTYYIIIKKLLRATFLAQILATFGLGVFVRYLAQYMWSPDFRTIKEPLLAGNIGIGGIFVGTPQLVASIICVIAFVFLYVLMNKTELGFAILATSEDREAASLMGIDSHKMFALGWGVGCGCLGVAGAMMANFFYIFPEVGFNFGLIAYVAVALGGFGSVPGSFLAGIIIGVVEFLSGLIIAPAFKYAFVFLIYLLVVFIKPMGLFGRY
ncbi:MAG TPA: branched-chain amino acid ABC transporter permease [Thermodesulfobacteriota bacterium]|nr:branched-chain amino acid ABC transporter permease [Thermodesulfobacteriota bacterium]